MNLLDMLTAKIQLKIPYCQIILYHLEIVRIFENCYAKNNLFLTRRNRQINPY